MSQPFQPKLASTTDLIVFGGLALITLIFAVLVELNPENRTAEMLAGHIILWAVVVASFTLPLVFFLMRKRALDKFHYVTAHGIVVGWTAPEYAVRPEVIEQITATLLQKLDKHKMYSYAGKALAGCVVLFREPVFYNEAVYDRSLGRWMTQKVTGLQDGLVLYVGWREDITTSALEHELCHRVLQVYAGDPPQDVAHKMMADLGVL